MTKRLAIIPARGGSKRIKNKNIKLFCGRPMITYTLESVIKSKLFNKIHVSTDSSKIRKVCEKKIKFDFERPKKLSGDNTSVMSVVNYVVKKYKDRGLNYDEVWLIFPCSPLIDIKDFLNISKLVKKNKNKKTILTVCEYPSPIERSYKLSNKKYLKPIDKNNFKKRTQDLSQSYYETGAIMAIPKRNFTNINNKPNLKNLAPYFVEKYKSIDVNNIKDWNFAELLYKSVKIRGNI